MKNFKLSWIDEYSKFLLYDDNNRLIKISLGGFSWIAREPFNKTIERYLRPFNFPEKDLRNIKWRF